MKQLKMNKALLLVAGLAVMMGQAGCCTKSGDPKNKADTPWGTQGKTGTGGLPGGMNEPRR
jgi:hypothetical protein